MKISLKNNVRTTMASRHITMWKDLSERLKDKQKYSITRTSLARQIEQEYPAYSLLLIEALCNELQCLPNDLFHIEISDATPDEIYKLTKRDKPFEFGNIIEKSESIMSTTQKVTSMPDLSSVTDSDNHYSKAVSKHKNVIDIEEDDLVGGKISHFNVNKIKS